jgi:hypothetical protein
MDPWNIIAAVGTVVTLVAIMLAIRWRPRAKRLAFYRRSSSRLRHSEADRHGVRVTVGDDHRELSNPFVLSLRIGNTGGQPVHPNDFDREMVVTIGAEIVSASLDRASPSQLCGTVDWHWRPNCDELLVSPTLLNESDWIEFTIITDGPPDVSVDARIAGVKQVCDLDAMAERRRLTVEGALVELISGVAQTFGEVGQAILHISFRSKAKREDRREKF